MDLKRFYTTNDIFDAVVINGDEFIHAIKVTRHKVGYKIIVCNNSDIDYYATIVEINKDNLVAKIDEKIKNDTESKENIVLYIGANKDIDIVVQKATELGVSKVVPFSSQHSNYNNVNIERLQKIILESSKQCGRSKLMKISDVITFEEAISQAKNTDVLFFYEYERENKVNNVPLNGKDISVFIGCEGGFSDKEVEFAKASGVNLLTLGKRILRVATAVVSGLTLVLNRLEEI